MASVFRVMPMVVSMWSMETQISAPPLYRRHYAKMGHTSKPLLVLLLDRKPLLLELLVILMLDQALKEEQILQPRILIAANRLRDERAETRVALVEPAARGDAVRNVPKLLAAVEVDKVFQDRCLYELRVQFGNTVHFEGAEHGKIGHTEETRGCL